MIRLNIHEAKTHLSSYLRQLASGDRILLCRRNVPIAEIRGLSKPLTTPRPVGLDKGKFQVTEAFFEPLPEELLDAFEGR